MSDHVPEKLLTAARTGRRQRGVTLLELMVVISILAILASIALPTYRRYLIRSQRTEAKIALLQLQTAQEKFYMQNNSFTDNLTDGVAGWAGSYSDHRDGQVHDRGGSG